MVYTVGII